VVDGLEIRRGEPATFPAIIEVLFVDPGYEVVARQDRGTLNEVLLYQAGHHDHYVILAHHLRYVRVFLEARLA
jgi:hypothetical protein